MKGSSVASITGLNKKKANSQQKQEKIKTYNKASHGKKSENWHYQFGSSMFKSNLFRLNLKVFSEGEYTTYSGSSFQILTTRWEKK